jgi:hypothetical protein
MSKGSYNAAATAIEMTSKAMVDPTPTKKFRMR